MFDNEVIISKKDKDILCSLLEQVNEILDKYPYSTKTCTTITAMSRAKTSAKEAQECVELLYTEIID